jgi:hypothetical protein
MQNLSNSLTEKLLERKLIELIEKLFEKHKEK